MLRTSFLMLYCIQEIVRLRPLSSRLDPHGRVSTTVGPYLKYAHNWTIGWVCTILLHPTPHRRRGMMMMLDHWFLDVRLCHPTGWVGLRQILTLPDLCAVVDAVVSDIFGSYSYFDLYVRHICISICMWDIYVRDILLCMYETYPSVVLRDILLCETTLRYNFSSSTYIYVSHITQR